MTTTKQKLNGEFLIARDALKQAMDELSAAQTEYNELIECESKVEDELQVLAARFKATDAAAVTRKADLTQQLAELRATLRAIETKRLGEAHTQIAQALAQACEPYRAVLKSEMDKALKRFVALAGPFYRDVASVTAAGQHTQLFTHLSAHMPCSWVNHPDQAQLVLARMNRALDGKGLIEFPPPAVSPG